MRAAPIHAAKQAADGLTCHLAQDVPKRHVDAADRMRQRATAPHPEAVLVELLTDALGLEGVLPFKERNDALDRCQH